MIIAHPATTLLRETAERQQAFDQLLALWHQEYRAMGGTIFCGKGCQSCCMLAVNSTLSEAMLLLTHLDTTQRALVAERALKARELAMACHSLKEWLKCYREEMGGCPFLDEAGSCSVYSVRPLSCRSLLATREASWCATDFSTLSATDRYIFLAGLDRRAVAFPTHYAATPQEVGRELEEATMRAETTTHGASVLGLLLYLIWLEDVHSLSTRITTSVQDCIRYLEHHALLNPYLILCETK